MQTRMPAPVSAPSVVRRWTPRRVILATLVVVGVIGGFFLFDRFSTIVFVVFVATVFAIAMRPAVLWLGRYRIPPWAGVLLIYLAIALIVVGVVAVLVPLLVAQGTHVVQDVPSYYTELRNQLSQSSSQILRRIAVNIPTRLSLPGLGGTSNAQATTPDDQQAVVVQGFAILGSISWSLFSFFAVFLIAFFWTLDRDQIVRAASLIVPIDNRDAALEIWETVEFKVGAYIRGQAILMLAIGVLCGIAFFLIGLKSALILAVLAGIFEAIPYLGPILTAVVAIVITLSEAPDRIVWVLIAITIIQQCENAILVPRIMDRAVGVNAIVTLLAIAAFGSLMGILGAILAIPLAAIIQVLLDNWVLNREQETLPLIEGRDRASRLRYQAQDLAQDIRGRIQMKGLDDDDENSVEEQIEALVGEVDEILMQLTTAAPPQVTSPSAGGLP